ncbi:MAG: hypothetical protein ACHQ1G_03775 [Planctomycetota bacterium]
MRVVRVAVVLVGVFACAKAPPSKVTVSSTADASAPIVDDDYRFRIAWPGDGWKLLGEADVRNLCPDAVAGAIYANNMFGVVIVENAPGTELEPFARLLTENMPIEEKKVAAFEKATFAGKEAVRYHVSGQIEGMGFSYAGIVFFHQDHAYQVLAWAAGDRLADVRLKQFHDAFSLTDGEVTGRVRRDAVKDARGVGFRVTGGVFESVTGLHVAPVLPWTIAVGVELDLMDTEAEVGIVHQSPEIYVALTPEKAPGEGREAMAARLRESLAADVGAVVTDESVVIPFAGGDLSLRALRRDGPPAFEYLHGVGLQGDEVVQVTAWYAAAKRQEARTLVADALRGVTFLSPDRRAALKAALLAAPDPENAVGEGWSLRGGVYRDFDRDIEWTKPKGFWRASAGDDARLANEDATLYLTEPDRGLTALLLLEEGEGWSAEEYHATITEQSFGAGAPKPVPRRIGDADGLVSEGDRSLDGPPLRFRIATAVHGGVAMQFVVWAPPEVLARESAAADAAIDGVRFRQLDPSGEQDGRYHDLRFGHSIEAPKGWPRKDMTPEGAGTIASFVNWSKDGGMLGVLAIVVMGEGQDEKWFLDFIDQFVRDGMRGFSGAREQTESTLAGFKTRRLRWARGGESLEIDLLVRERALYAVFAAGTSAQRPTLDAARRSFRLLD